MLINLILQKTITLKAKLLKHKTGLFFLANRILFKRKIRFKKLTLYLFHNKVLFKTFFATLNLN